MKINVKDLKAITELFKTTENKEKTVSLHIENGRLHIEANHDRSVLILSKIKTDEKDMEKVTIKKSFLNNLEKVGEGEIDIKINKRTVSSKVGKMNFNTAILAKEFENNIGKHAPTNATKMILDKQTLKTLVEAKKFTSDSKLRPELQGVNLKSDGKKLIVSATDSFKMYFSEIEVLVNEEFNVILRTETIDTLEKINEVFGGKGLPIQINSGGIFIDTPVLYYHSAFVERPYPNLETVLSRHSQDATVLFEHKFTEAEIKDLKTISIRGSDLKFEKKESEFVELEVFTENAKNTLLIVPEKETEDFSFKTNLQNVLLGLEIVPEITLKKSTATFKDDKKTILIMAVR